MLLNCLIGRRLKAPRAAIPIRAGPTTGMPMVILALDMAPLPSKPHRPAAEAGQLEVLLRLLCPQLTLHHMWIQGGGQEAMRCLRRPTVPFHRGWSRVNLNHRPHLYRVVSAMAWGVGSSAAAPPTNGNISAVTGSAGRRGQRRRSSTMITMTAMRTIVPMPIYTTGSSLPLSHRDFRRSRVGNCPGRARRDCMGSPGSRAF
jgi:hypothetical protein